MNVQKEYTQEGVITSTTRAGVRVMTRTKTTKMLSSLVQELEPRSEERLDIVERDEEMRQRIAARRRQKLILCILLTLFVGVPVVGLSIQNSLMTDTQRERVSHIFH